MSTEVAPIEAEKSLTAKDMKAQVQRIQEVMQAVMKPQEHYGTIPGCGTKPTLLKAGAEKLMMTFRLAVDPQIEDLSANGVRRYRVITRVTAQSTGLFLGSGVGECSSDEEKYAWREAVCKEEWDETDVGNRRDKWRKGNPPYVIHQIHTNPSDVANTILKMAKKRSLVDAILTVTAASDIFTQDLEEMGETAAETRHEDGAGPRSCGSEQTHEPKPSTQQASDAPAPSRAALFCQEQADKAPDHVDATPHLTFGKHKGKAVTDVSIPDDYLSWLEGQLKQQLTDPKLARFHDEKQRLLDAIRGELIERNVMPIENQ